MDITISSAFTSMLIRLVVCIVANWVIIDRLYYAKSRRRDFYFTFMLISLAIFFIIFYMIFVLDNFKSKVGIGVGIGLFGIFSIMRYRTDTMPVREMTYLFIVISLSLVNAIASGISIVELLLTNLIFIIGVWICEKRLHLNPAKMMQYDRIDLITPERRDDLIADIERRTGLKVVNVEVGGIDFLRDMAVVKVYYISESVGNSVDKQTKLKLTEMNDTL